MADNAFQSRSVAVVESWRTLSGRRSSLCIMNIRLPLQPMQACTPSRTRRAGRQHISIDARHGESFGALWSVDAAGGQALLALEEALLRPCRPRQILFLATIVHPFRSALASRSLCGRSTSMTSDPAAVHRAAQIFCRHTDEARTLAGSLVVGGDQRFRPFADLVGADARLVDAGADAEAGDTPP